MLALPLKGYAVDPSQLGLDAVGNFAVYAGGSNTVTGTSTINGDVGLGPNGVQNFGTGFTINGTYRVDDTANNGNAYSGTISGGTVVQDLDYVSATVSSVSAYAASLAATTNFTLINNHTTITGNGGYNVISVSGINLATSRKLTLNGTASDVFIFNVGTASFGGSARSVIELNGVSTNHVLFNFSGSGSALSVGANLTLFGTFITPNGSMSLTSDTVYGGLFAGNNLSLTSGTVTADVFALPEPSSFVLVGISCVFGLGLWSRRRRGR